MMVTELQELEISQRTYNALVNGGPITTISQLMASSDNQLMMIPGFGKIALRETRAALRTWTAERGTPDGTSDNRGVVIKVLVEALRQAADRLEQIYFGNGASP